MPVHLHAADDGLTRITGIEPHIAAQLRKAGTHTMDDLAWSTPEQVVAVCGSGVVANTRSRVD